VVAPFDTTTTSGSSSGSTGTGPLAYGGILGGGFRVLDAGGPEVTEALSFARERGLFSGQEEGELDVVGARRLDCDVVGDGAHCEQVLWEVALPNLSDQPHKEPVTAWCVGRSREYVGME
jgi:hypothetical protein